MTEPALPPSLLESLTRGSELVSLGTSGRRSLGCWLVLEKGRPESVVKLSSLDPEVLAINRLALSGAIQSSAGSYCLAAVEQIRMAPDALVVRYPFVPHQPLCWPLYHDARVQQMLAVCAADFNASNCGRAIRNGLPRKRFSFGLTAKKLAPILAGDDAARSDEMAQRAEQAYGALLVRSRDLGIFQNVCLCHNDLVPSNIGLLTPPSGPKDRWSQGSTEPPSVDDLRLPFLLLDCDNAVLAPFGFDLRFILLETSSRSLRFATLQRVSEHYRNRLRSHQMAISVQAIAHAAVLGFADAWLNVHRRSRTSRYSERFQRCLRFCEVFLQSADFAV
ncbi:hypothetical protein EVJ50_06680 [Synechococcus sp. RSCCF101]|uniref:hypothetical protein n=1 Tax=Synechococcus sp. RSCCF101 TaxID=2511069 RepID=UPI00124420B5|nr:hypothetical protein [Synechococcus sp. RSCCF101]QEY31968.1 hypothetical protein EVJ50_06680 [Synechococcus sp. RSCCF101]